MTDLLRKFWTSDITKFTPRVNIPGSNDEDVFSQKNDHCVSCSIVSMCLRVFFPRFSFDIDTLPLISRPYGKVSIVIGVVGVVGI